MSDAWKDYPGAPDLGTAICAVSDLTDGEATCVEIDGFPLIVIQQNARLRAFVNACPHQYLPLNRQGDRILSQDGTTLRCTNHSAGFSAETGEGVEGLGLGACLDPVPVAVNGDSVVIGEGT